MALLAAAVQLQVAPVLAQRPLDVLERRLRLAHALQRFVVDELALLRHTEAKEPNQLSNLSRRAEIFLDVQSVI